MLRPMLLALALVASSFSAAALADDRSHRGSRYDHHDRGSVRHHGSHRRHDVHVHHHRHHHHRHPRHGHHRWHAPRHVIVAPAYYAPPRYYGPSRHYRPPVHHYHGHRYPYYSRDPSLSIRLDIPLR